MFEIAAKRSKNDASRLIGRGLAVVGLIMLVSFGLRLFEWPEWTNKGGSPPVLPTPDAYAWLAGLEGAGRLTGWAMSGLVGVLSAATGYEPQWVAFWLPAGLASLPGIVIAFVCWQRSRPLAGLVGGVFAAVSLGYLGRTRLGYADTDLFALFLPTALAALWAWVIDRSAGPSNDSGSQPPKLLVPVTLLVLLSGLVQWLYPSGYLVLAAIAVTAVVVGLAVAATGMSGTFLTLLAICLLAFHFDWWGVVAAIGLSCLFARQSRPPLAVGLVAVVLVAVLIAIGDAAFLQQMWSRASAYAGLGGSPRPISDWVLPRVDASIDETAAVSWREYIQRVGTHWTFFFGGLAGFVLAICRWPALLTFLPLLVLGLLSIELGHRFAMYAAPPLGLGLGLGLATILERLRFHRRVSMLAQLALAGAIAAVVGSHVRDLEPVPAVPARWAGALMELEDFELNHGRIWAWWDEGYAAQFYSRLPTLVDGGNASRLRIFALGRVFGARDPEQAANFLRGAASERMNAIRASEDWRRASYDSVPLVQFTHLDAEAVQRMLDHRSSLGSGAGREPPDELVVASWQTLRKAQWADLYGRWRLTGGENGYGQIASLRPPIQLDEAAGVLQTADGPVPLRSIHILESGSRYREQWTNTEGAHAIVNNDAGEGVFMDSELFQTLAVQLLVADPTMLDRHFELVVDAAPAARVFRVRPVSASADPDA